MFNWNKLMYNVVVWVFLLSLLRIDMEMSNISKSEKSEKKILTNVIKNQCSQQNKQNKNTELHVFFYFYTPFLVEY